MTDLLPFEQKTLDDLRAGVAIAGARRRNRNRILGASAALLLMLGATMQLTGSNGSDAIVTTRPAASPFDDDAASAEDGVDESTESAAVTTRDPADGGDDEPGLPPDSSEPGEPDTPHSRSGQVPAPGVETGTRGARLPPAAAPNPTPDPTATEAAPTPTPGPVDAATLPQAAAETTDLAISSIEVRVDKGESPLAEAIVTVDGLAECERAVAEPVAETGRLLQYAVGSRAVTGSCDGDASTVLIPLGHLPPGPWQVMVNDVVAEFAMPEPAPHERVDEPEASRVLLLLDWGDPALSQVGWRTTDDQVCLRYEAPLTYSTQSASCSPSELDEPLELLELGTLLVAGTDIEVRVNDEVFAFAVPESISVLKRRLVPIGEPRYEAERGVVISDLEAQVTIEGGRCQTALALRRFDAHTYHAQTLLEPRGRCSGSGGPTIATGLVDHFPSPIVPMDWDMDVGFRSLSIAGGGAEPTWPVEITDFTGPLDRADITVRPDERDGGYVIEVGIEITPSAPCSAFRTSAGWWRLFSGQLRVVEWWLDDDANRALCPEPAQPFAVQMEYPASGHGVWPITINDATRHVVIGEPDTQCAVRDTVVDSPLSAEECDALAEFDRPDDNWDSWFSPTDPCTWIALICGPSGLETINAVKQDDLPIVSAVGRLVNLREITLNEWSGTELPPEIASLPVLRKLHVFNELPRELVIPALGSLPNLEDLDTQALIEVDHPSNAPLPASLERAALGTSRADRDDPEFGENRLRALALSDLPNLTFLSLRLDHDADLGPALADLIDTVEWFDRGRNSTACFTSSVPEVEAWLDEKQPDWRGTCD